MNEFEFALITVTDTIEQKKMLFCIAEKEKKESECLLKQNLKELFSAKVFHTVTAFKENQVKIHQMKRKYVYNLFIRIMVTASYKYHQLQVIFHNNILFPNFIKVILSIISDLNSQKHLALLIWIANQFLLLSFSLFS